MNLLLILFGVIGYTFLGVREFPSRVKCATLAWHAMNSAIRRDDRPASTE